MSPVKSKMTAWFNPPQLALTGLWVASSTFFGGMFDRRELMASLDPFDEDDFKLTHDHSGHKELWFDYVADTGDGWASTHAVARLLARPSLEVGAEKPLERGKLLFFGGDEIYPTPTPGYETKLDVPYFHANLREAAGGLDLAASKFGLFRGEYVYAIPGNHDWYDGLTAFTHLFCARRPARDGQPGNAGHAVCGRRSLQTRSYFAVKLPGNFWLFGVDVQFEGFVDDEQIAYFNRIAQTLMDDGSDVVVCVPDPQWAYLDPAAPEVKFKNLSYAVDVITGAINDKPAEPGAELQTVRFQRGDRARRHNLRAMLSGDMHLYARYAERDPAGHCIHYIMCGLGGAFAHPSNWIQKEKRFLWKFRPPRPLDAQALVKDEIDGVLKYPRELMLEGPQFPTKCQSALLGVRNLAFAAYNPGFGLTVAAACFLMSWLLIGIGRSINANFIPALADAPMLAAFEQLVVRTFLASPWPLLAALAMFLGLSVFTGMAKPWRFVVGGMHSGVNLALFLGAFTGAVKGIAALGIRGLDALVALPFVMAAYGFLVPPTVMGFYLMVMLLVFRRHRTEAFSSMRIEDFKGFLRMHIDSAGTLRIYPVVIDKVPRDDGADLSPRLLEPAIVITPSRARAAFVRPQDGTEGVTPAD